jgi:uncharacterized membrane protein
VYCGHLMMKLNGAGRVHRLAYYRVLPLAPALLILGVITLVTAKPF